MPNIYVKRRTYDTLISWRERYEKQHREETGKLIRISWSTLIDELIELAQAYREAQEE